MKLAVANVFHSKAPFQCLQLFGVSLGATMQPRPTADLPWCSFPTPRLTAAHTALRLVDAACALVSMACATGPLPLPVFGFYSQVRC